MLVIRLARAGRNKYPVYRIVAAESARTATGKFIAVLGNYNPHTKELSLHTDEIKKHLGNGAQPSNTVIKLLQREKVELPAWVKLKTKAAKVTDEPAADEAATTASDDTTPEAAAPAEERVATVTEDVAAEAPEANINATETAENQA